MNDVLKPDLVSVVTVHMVYFCASLTLKYFKIKPGNLGWVRDSLMQESMGYSQTK